MPFTFVANLKPFTFHRGPGIRRFDAYLQSVDYNRGKQAQLAQAVLEDDALLCSDNGNVDGIRALLSRFADAAGKLDTRRKREEGDRYARPGDLSASLTADYRDLAKQIREASKEVTQEPYVRAAIEHQHAMGADYAIGMEDFTIATMTGLSIEPEYVNLPASFYADLNARAVQFAIDTKDGRYGPPPARVFAGVHALDYDQAVQAGQLVGQAGIEGIATGLVGALRDRNYVDFRVERGQVIELEGATARPYLRVMEIAAGLHVGYHSVTGRSPQFHALGAGTPILLPLLGLLNVGGTYTATDSTSPIVDGWSGPTISLYVDEPAPLKLRAEKIAQSWLEGGRGWDCTCSYCRNFEEAHPPELAAATRWWQEGGKPRIEKRHLHRSEPLATMLPFLGRHPDDDIRRVAGLARVGHNHAVIQRIERVVREALESGDVGALDRMLKGYLAMPGAQAWRRAAREAHAIGRTARATMWG